MPRFTWALPLVAQAAVVRQPPNLSRAREKARLLRAEALGSEAAGPPGGRDPRVDRTIHEAILGSPTSELGFQFIDFRFRTSEIRKEIGSRRSEVSR